MGYCLEEKNCGVSKALLNHNLTWTTVMRGLCVDMYREDVKVHGRVRIVFMGWFRVRSAFKNGYVKQGK